MTHLDDTSKEEIVASLEKATGREFDVTIEAYQGTPWRVMWFAVFLEDTVAGGKMILRQQYKNRMGWVNCRIRWVMTPIKCFKCWTLGLSPCSAKWTGPRLVLDAGRTGTSQSGVIKNLEAPYVPKKVIRSHVSKLLMTGAGRLYILQSLIFNHCNVAHEQFTQNVRGSKPFKHTYQSSVVIWLTNPEKWSDFVVASLKRLQFYSCYAPLIPSRAHGFPGATMKGTQQHFPMEFPRDFNSWAAD